jgi:hypothetical protein
MGVMQRFQGKIAAVYGSFVSATFGTASFGTATFASAPLKAQTASGLTAHAGGGKAGALQLTGAMASVGTVATAADSVLLPAAVVGGEFFLSNDGVASMQVFGNGTDTINLVATATGVAQANGVAALYFCTKVGNWSRVQSS